MEIPQKIALTGFDLLPEELEKIQKILQTYNKKFSEVSEYDFLQVDLKKIEKDKAFHHEIKGRLKMQGKILSSEVREFNVFKGVNEVLEKILHEAQHLKRTSRQTRI